MESKRATFVNFISRVCGSQVVQGIKLSEFTLHRVNLRAEFHVTANTILFTVKYVHALGNGGGQGNRESIVSRLKRRLYTRDTVLPFSRYLD